MAFERYSRSSVACAQRCSSLSCRTWKDVLLHVYWTGVPSMERCAVVRLLDWSALHGKMCCCTELLDWSALHAGGSVMRNATPRSRTFARDIPEVLLLVHGGAVPFHAGHLRDIPGVLLLVHRGAVPSLAGHGKVHGICWTELPSM